MITSYYLTLHFESSNLQLHEWIPAIEFAEQAIKAQVRSKY